VCIEAIAHLNELAERFKNPPDGGSFLEVKKAEWSDGRWTMTQE
jgi:hypothetical protein